MKLSFIVPVYNVERYLQKCVNSLINQHYDSYELILVDDGSTDGSGVLCDEIARANGENGANDGMVNIRVIHKENGGLSAARNTGIAAANGEYLCFVDSDDYLEPNVLGGLMEQVEREQLDVLRYDYQNVRIVGNGENGGNSENGVMYEVFEPNKSPRYVDRCSDVVEGSTYLNTRMGYACYAVMYIMRREIVPTFTEGIHFEDVDWLPRMMLQAKRVNSTTTVVYNYLIRQGSITQTQGNIDKVRKNVEDNMIVISKYCDYLHKYPDCQWLRNMRSSMVAGVIVSVASHFYAERNKYLSQLKRIHVYPLTLANHTRTYLRRARLINFSPRLAIFLLHLKNIR